MLTTSLMYSRSLKGAVSQTCWYTQTFDFG